MRRLLSIFSLILIGGFIAMSGAGCAGSKQVKMTEPGYVPTHVALGEIVAYTSGVSTVKYNDLIRMTEQQVSKALRKQSVKFIKEKQLDKMETLSDKTVFLEMEMTFQSGMRSMTGEDSYNVLVTYKLNRRSDGLTWLQGSAKSSDEAVSQSAGLDLQKAIEYAAVSVSKKVKNAMKGE